jgi:hypothetical protein
LDDQPLERIESPRETVSASEFVEKVLDREMSLSQKIAVALTRVSFEGLPANFYSVREFEKAGFEGFAVVVYKLAFFEQYRGTVYVHNDGHTALHLGLGSWNESDFGANLWRMRSVLSDGHVVITRHNVFEVTESDIDLTTVEPSDSLASSYEAHRNAVETACRERGAAPVRRDEFDSFKAVWKVDHVTQQTKEDVAANLRDIALLASIYAILVLLLASIAILMIVTFAFGDSA